MNNIKNEKMAPLAGSLISTKPKLKKIGVLPTTVFEGFGNDPTARLKAIVASQYSEKNKSKKQKGGIFPIIPLASVGASALGMLAGKILQDIYSVIKKKITGSGLNIKLDHKNNNDKKQFLLNIIKQI